MRNEVRLLRVAPRCNRTVQCRATKASLTRRYRAQPQFGGHAHWSPQLHALPQQQRAVTARSELASRGLQDAHVQAVVEHAEQEQALVVLIVMELPRVLDWRSDTVTGEGRHARCGVARVSLSVSYACRVAVD